MADMSEQPKPEPAPESPSGTGIGIWGRFGSIIRKISHWFSFIGIFGIVMLVTITAADVIGSKGFSRPFPGFTGVTELAQLIAMSFGMAVAYLGGHHIKVEILMHRLPTKPQAVIGSLVNLLGFVIFALMIWQLFILGRSFQVSREVVDQIWFPLYPFPYAVAVALVPVCLALLLDLGNSLSRVVRR
ncbi:MAG: hypothetical protein A2W25_05505 [candidate division Zixibacteria bacterium RBG_16_53_22]|nr:MAG: hypothetical protein A2W25_05505 [candidate division Zixibacteria bacterium RBG_16_53_22]